MTMLVNMPPARPYSAGRVPISSLTSATPSIDGTHGERNKPRPTFTVFETPSTETSPVAGGDPLAVNNTLVPVSLGRVSSQYRFPTTPGAVMYRNKMLCPFHGMVSTIFWLTADPTTD